MSESQDQKGNCKVLELARNSNLTVVEISRFNCSSSLFNWIENRNLQSIQNQLDFKCN